MWPAKKAMASMALVAGTVSSGRTSSSAIRNSSSSSGSQLATAIMFSWPSCATMKPDHIQTTPAMSPPSRLTPRLRTSR